MKIVKSRFVSFSHRFHEDEKKRLKKSNQLSPCSRISFIPPSQFRLRPFSFADVRVHPAELLAALAAARSHYTRCHHVQRRCYRHAVRQDARRPRRRRRHHRRKSALPAVRTRWLRSRRPCENRARRVPCIDYCVLASICHHLVRLRY